MTNVISEFQGRIDALSGTLAMMNSSTKEANRCCDLLTRRSRQLDSLTSPASDASQMLTRASHNLNTTLTMMKDSREKFDTVADCEPSIKRLYEGARGLMEARKKERDQRKKDANNSGSVMKHISNSNNNSNQFLSEQDVYSAADSMDIIRDAYAYFSLRKAWKSTPSALGGLERVHQLGIDAMCLLVQSHFTTAGPAIKVKQLKYTQATKTEIEVDLQNNINVSTDPNDNNENNNNANNTNPPTRQVALIKDESAVDTRKRISNALHNRNLMKAVGEYEEYLPLDTRSVRELRAIFECLGGDSLHIPNSASADRTSLRNLRQASSKVVRTEKIGGGSFTNLTKIPLKTGFPHLNAYGESRKVVAYAAMNGFHRHLRDERKKKTLSRQSVVSDGSATFDSSDIDAAARDAIRCLEHALVVVAGEKSLYKCIVSPTSSHNHDDTKISEDFKDALIASYNHVVSCVVDRTMDIIETVFLKEAGAAMHRSLNSDDDDQWDHQLVRIAGSSAAAGLRILDGVRMLGPSLAKLCDMGDNKTAIPNNKGETVAGSLCICIHRLTVKNTAKVMESLAKAIQNDPNDGDKFRPPDARVAAVSSDVCWALSLISPFSSAYKSVTKRRALPWDQNIGDQASDMDSYIRFLVSRLMTNLQAKSKQYLRDVGPAAQAKSSLFLMNNTFYLLEYQMKSMAKISEDTDIDEEEYYVLTAKWFKEKVGKLFEIAKQQYLTEWENLNKHLTSVDKNDLTYQNDKLLSLESGRLIKTRFSGFIEEFEKTYTIHKNLAFTDQKLRMMLQMDVKDIFLPRYKRFFDKYSQLQFSKKKMDEYLKYPPKRVEYMIDDLFGLK